MRKLAIPYTIRRQGVYQLNLRWGHQFIRQTLSTRDPLLALSKVNQVLVLISTHPNSRDSIETLRERILVALKGGKVSLLPAGYSETTNENPLLLSAAFDLYCAEKSVESWSIRTLKQNQSTFGVLMEIVGDMLLEAVTKVVAREYKQGLLVYPANRNKGLRKSRDLGQLLREEWPTISVETIRNSLGRVSSFFSWCVMQGYINENPFSGLSPKRSRSARSERSPFNVEELKAVFGTPLYTRKIYQHNWQYWLPLLGLFTGARIEELCQLRGQDIKAEGSIYYFDIHGEGDLHNRVKTACAVRCIPVHPALIKLGVIQLKNNAGDGFLFNLKRINTNLSHKPSQWFGDYKTALGFPKSTKVFHSFRHTLRDELTRNDVPAEHVREILGHEQPDETYGRYGSSIPVEILYKSLLKVNFTAVSLLPSNWEDDKLIEV